MKTAVEILYEEMHRIRLEDECENIGAIDFKRMVEVPIAHIG